MLGSVWIFDYQCREKCQSFQYAEYDCKDNCGYKSAYETLITRGWNNVSRGSDYTQILISLPAQSQQNTVRISYLFVV